MGVLLPTQDTGDLMEDHLAFTGRQPFRENEKPVSIAPETIDTGRLFIFVLSGYLPQPSDFRFIFADTVDLQAA